MSKLIDFSTFKFYWQKDRRRRRNLYVKSMQGWKYVGENLNVAPIENWFSGLTFHQLMEEVDING